MCDFIRTYKNILDYDWYIKIRPEVKLLEPINFNILSDMAINARARVYRGPKKIVYGMSINGDDEWKNVGDCYYDDIQKEIVLDDILYIFHNNMIKNNAFESINYSSIENEWFQTNIIQNKAFNRDKYDNVENEWYHTTCWVYNKIKLNVIGINLELVHYKRSSGHINI